MTTTDTLCRECRGTGERAYQTNHPMCGRCYGTGIEGMTMGRLEDEARVARVAAEFEFPEMDPAEADPAEAEEAMSSLTCPLHGADCEAWA